MKHKLAIFDLDGTILNTLDDLADSLNFALTCEGFPARTLDEVRRFVGNGILKLVERALPEGSDQAALVRVFETFKVHYKDHCAIKTAPYKGIPSLLAELKCRSIKLAVVSNKADFAVQTLCADYFGGIFDYAVGEREGIRRKPAPDAVNEVLAHFGIAPTDAVYIGDSEVDVETARNASLSLIAVDWGFRDKACLRESGAECIVSDPAQIAKLI